MKTLYEALRKYTDSDAYPFHMPGHKRRMGWIEDPFGIDITEIDGFDNLHCAEGIILEAEKKSSCFCRCRGKFFFSEWKHLRNFKCCLGMCSKKRNNSDGKKQS